MLSKLTSFLLYPYLSIKFVNTLYLPIKNLGEFANDFLILDVFSKLSNKILFPKISPKLIKIFSLFSLFLLSHN